ncbi:MAG: aspartate aminotransferase family protein [Sphingomonadaceae bacterium]|nr:aspartate aminotransferase family protein [Sphingomonadaceae bacterium]
MTDATAALDRAAAAAKAFLAGLDTAPAAAPATLAAMRARLGGPLGAEGVPADKVIDDLIAGVEGGINGSAGGRHFAWVIGGTLPASLAADWLTSAWDQNAGLTACAPAASVVEEIAGGWLKDVLGLPASASFALVTGCQMAHATCLAAARHAVLARAGWDVAADGLFGAPPITVLANGERHASVDRALRLLGFGNCSLVALAVGDDGRVAPDTLAAALAAAPGPVIVSLAAGDLNTGACDDFAALVPLAKAAGAWVHVDGAFGLWARASARHREAVAGIELADSWASDAHKWLNTPYDCGLAFVADPVAHRAAMTVSTSYMPVAADAREAVDWTPEWSRRARGFAVYAALRELGRDGIAAMIDRCCDHAAALAHGIGALPGAELLAGPGLNQALVSFGGATDAVIARINAGGEAMFGGTTWRGRRAMRISVSSWRTTEADVARTIAAVKAVL